MKKLIKITAVALSSLFAFAGTGMCLEKLSKESIQGLLNGQTFILVNLSHDRVYEKRFRKDGTWVDISENENPVDYGSWHVNDSGQFCQISEFRVGKENCSYMYKEGDNYLTYNEKVSTDGEKIIKEVTAWEIAADYVAKQNNDGQAPTIADIRKKALETAPAAGQPDDEVDIFMRLKKSFADFFN